MDMTLHVMAPRERRKYYRQLEQDFHQGEYPPWFVMRKQLAEGTLEGIVCRGMDDARDAEDADLAYAFNAASHANGWVLISYYAVFPTLRGTGVGSRFLEALSHRYADKRGLVVEVEKPEEADTEADRETRLRRIRFYERAGFRMVPDMEYRIWGIPMHLMVLPIRAAFDEMNAELPERLRETYLDLMGPVFIHRMTVRRLSPG